MQVIVSYIKKLSLNLTKFYYCCRASPSHLEASSTSADRPGNCQSPGLAVENVDVRQLILLDVSSDGVHVSQFRAEVFSQILNCSM